MPELKSNYPRAVPRRGKTAAQLSGLVDAYFSLFLLNGALIFLGIVAVFIAERRDADYALISIVFANFCVSGPLLLIQLGPRSPISKALVGLMPADRPRAVGWFFVSLGMMLGLGLLIPLALHIATYFTLHRNGIKLNLSGLNKRQIDLQLGSMGRQELADASPISYDR